MFSGVLLTVNSALEVKSKRKAGNVEFHREAVERVSVYRFRLV